MPKKGAVILPQPEEISESERSNAMAAYFMMFGAVIIGFPLPIISLIAAVVYYFITAPESKFTAFHALQSLLSQILVSLLNTGAIIWITIKIINMISASSTFSVSDDFIIYMGCVAFINVLYFIFSLIGAFQAYKGRFYYFIFFGPLAYHIIYLRPPKKQKDINKPPSSIS